MTDRQVLTNPKGDPRVIAQLLRADVPVVERAGLPLVAKHVAYAIAILDGLTHEPLPVASRDADHCDYPDCEHHWELVVDWALAAMKKLHESAEPDTDHPEIPAIIPAAAFRAFVDEHARLMRIRASAPQGASRDASSEFVCPKHGPVQQLTDSGDCPMCYQDRHAQRTGE